MAMGAYTVFAYDATQSRHTLCHIWFAANHNVHVV